MNTQTLRESGAIRYSAATAMGEVTAFLPSGDLDRLALGRLDELRNLPGRVPRVLELGCGEGEQTLRMLAKGALVTAVDRHDHGPDLRSRAESIRRGPALTFVHASMENMPAGMVWPFDLVFSQMAIHCLPYWKAMLTLERVRSMMAAGASIYISVAGLNGELGEGYPHRPHTVDDRWAPLAPNCAARYGIEGPVCLYSQLDLWDLLVTSGFKINLIWQTQDGDIMAVATR